VYAKNEYFFSPTAYLPTLRTHRAHPPNRVWPLRSTTRTNAPRTPRESQPHYALAYAAGPSPQPLQAASRSWHGCSRGGGAKARCQRLLELQGRRKAARAPTTAEESKGERGLKAKASAAAQRVANLPWPVWPPTRVTCGDTRTATPPPARRTREGRRASKPSPAPLEAAAAPTWASILPPAVVCLQNCQHLGCPSASDSRTSLLRPPTGQSHQPSFRTLCHRCTPAPEATGFSFCAELQHRHREPWPPKFS
jgi:hypothetical protein